MRYSYFRVSANDPERKSQLLNAFLAANTISSVEQHFVADGANSYWAVCVGTVEQATGHVASKASKRSAVDYRDKLSPEIFAVYAKLRTLRNQLAEQQSTPPYAIFTNEQLAAMAQLENPGKMSMAQIDGIGEKRLSLYADTFLAVLQAKDD